MTNISSDIGSLVGMSWWVPFTIAIILIVFVIIYYNVETRRRNKNVD